MGKSGLRGLFKKYKNFNDFEFEELGRKLVVCIIGCNFFDHFKNIKA